MAISKKYALKKPGDSTTVGNEGSERGCCGGKIYAGRAVGESEGYMKDKVKLPEKL